MSVPSHRRDPDALRRRIASVRDRVDIVAVIAKAGMKLGRGRKPRGQCPFHGSKSDSFSIDAERGFARCWGCQWSGDVIRFVQDHYGLSFGEALKRLEDEHGLDGLSAAPLHREKRPAPRSSRPVVSSEVMGRWIWKHARPNPDAVRIYLRARGVPAEMLGEARLRDIRFLDLAPVVAWQEDRKPESVPQAPAMVALVRRPPGSKGEPWGALGVHVTYLSPDLTDKMVRTRRDGSAMPARKMLGPVGGGGVLLGEYAPDAPLFIGEGLETVLSGMAIAGADDRAIGIAALSLDTMEGKPRLIKGALPLHDIRPDPDAAPALAFPHGGPVTALIDADMKPLRGPTDPKTRQFRGVAVIERRGAKPVRRAVTTAERAAICAQLVVLAWRKHGTVARAIRPHMGLDFNDAVRGV